MKASVMDSCCNISPYVRSRGSIHTREGSVPSTCDCLAQCRLGISRGMPTEFTLGLRGRHDHRDRQGLQPVGHRGSGRQASLNLRYRVRDDLRQAYRTPSELVSDIGHRQLPGRGQVVESGFARADHCGAQGRSHVFDVDDLDWHAEVGEHSSRAEQSLDKYPVRQRRCELYVRQDQYEGVGAWAADKRRAKYEGLSLASFYGRLERLFEFRFL